MKTRLIMAACCFCFLTTAVVFVSCNKSTVDTSTVAAEVTITALNCSGATISGSFISGEAYSGTATVPYTGGNGEAYPEGAAIPSTGVTGLTATLQAGTLTTGAGNLIFLIKGTPTAIGTASFAISLGGQYCSLSLTVAAPGSADCSTATGVAKLICLANAFKAQLDASQLATVQRTYLKTEAQKWSNLPQALVQSANRRVGLNFGAMTTTQVQAAKALIKEAAGTTPNEGWDEIEQIINADEYLAVNGGGSIYGAANYYIALLGTPATSGTFEIQFGGHHLAFANTYTNGVLAGATPSFRAVEPFAPFTWNGRTNQPMVQEKDAFSAMLTSLSPAELATARLSATFSDILLGPQKDGAFPATSSGLQCSNLSAAQKALVLNAIRTYVSDIDDADAAAIMTKYTNELDNTYIAYSGTTDVTAINDYVRIDGPSVWIEYSSQRGIVLSPTHPHSVWRDKTKDYGGN